MIDIHAHILPEVDDGSKCFSQSVDMLSASAAMGVTDVILTPHYRKEYKLDKQLIVDAFNQFELSVKKEGVPIRLYLGQEIYVNSEMKSLISQQKLLTINNTNFVLVEFDFENKKDICETVYELVSLGYKPIVAHIERYFYADIDVAFEIKELGGFIQINAPSVVQKQSRKVLKFVKQLLKNDLVDFVASDVHYMRENCMKKAYELIKKKYGEQMAERIFVLNAKQLIQG